MMQRSRMSLGRAFVFLLALGLVGNAAAQPSGYPSRPITMIVPFPPGGGDDILGRIIARQLAQKLGQAVVIENHPGAGGTIGMGILARSARDGYTIAVADSGQLAIAPNIHAKLPYDTSRDLIPVANVASSLRVLAVRSSLPVKTVRELIELAKSKPGALTYASAGTGSSAWLNMELFKSIAGVNILQIPYRGISAGVNALVAGQVDMTIGQIAPLAPLVKAGKLRLLATTSATRSAILPELPTMAEAGVKDYSADIWVGIVAPAGTPRDIIDKLNSAIVDTVKMPDVQRQFANVGYTATGDTPEQFGAMIKADSEKFAQIIRNAHITPR